MRDARSASRSPGSAARRPILESSWAVAELARGLKGVAEPSGVAGETSRFPQTPSTGPLARTGGFAAGDSRLVNRLFRRPIARHFAAALPWVAVRLLLFEALRRLVLLFLGRLRLLVHGRQPIVAEHERARRLVLLCALRQRGRARGGTRPLFCVRLRPLRELGADRLRALCRRTRTRVACAPCERAVPGLLGSSRRLLGGGRASARRAPQGATRGDEPRGGAARLRRDLDGSLPVRDADGIDAQPLLDGPCPGRFAGAGRRRLRARLVRARRASPRGRARLPHRGRPTSLAEPRRVGPAARSRSGAALRGRQA